MQPASMAPRKNRNWKDVQLILSSISLAVTLGLWGMWSSREKRTAGTEALAAVPTPPAAVEAGPMLMPGQTLYLNASAPQTTTSVSDQQQPKRRDKDKRGDGGGGGGGPSSGSS